MRKLVIIDEGHGINTKGKRSPDGRLLEYEFNRRVGSMVATFCRALGIEAVHLVPEVLDVPLSERVQRCNKLIADNKGAAVVLFSIHGNAAGNGDWKNARGWSAYTTKGQNNSDKLAEFLYSEIETQFAGVAGVKIRKEKSDGDSDWERDFTIIKGAKCPAVLSENFFYDNKDDLELMCDDFVQQKIAQAHAHAAKAYFKRLESVKR